MQTNDIKSTSDNIHEFEYYNIPKDFTGICKIKNDKSIRYYKNGELHREDGPAIEWDDGTKHWCQNGQKHRLDAPAVQCGNGDEEWYQYGQLHREDGPAVEYANGDTYWYQNGQRHRIDGPAVDVYGYKRYWIEGVEYSENDFNKKIKNMNAVKFKYVFDIKNDFTGIAEINGSIAYYKDGKFHREDGPAIEHPDGTKLWYVIGLCHRLDGPAIEYSNGQKDWWIDNKRHRLDGPAIEYPDGTKYWYIEGRRYSEEEYNKKIFEMKIQTFKNSFDIPKDFTGMCKVLSTKETRYYKDGKIHREDGPAIEDDYGDKFWYINGLLHRESGPACEYSNGDKSWYIHGQFHREDGLAIECKDGQKEWYANGKPHRLDGPAIEYSDGKKSWYIDGVKYSEEDFNNKIKAMSMIEFVSVSNVPYDFTGICKIGNQIRHFKDGKTHNENGPAIEYDGNKFWVQNNRYHRKDGPACEYADGKKEWRLNGQLHREDGPAIEYADGRKEWFIKGLMYTEEHFKMLVKTFETFTDIPLKFTGVCRVATFKQKHYYKNGKLHREDGPAVEWEDGTRKNWYQNDKLHRENGPAIEWADGTKFWYLNGKLHREDGPAKEFPDGSKVWCLNGTSYLEQDFNNKILEMNTKVFETSGDIPLDFTGICHVKNNDTIRYYKNGLLHREDGPAITHAKGDKEWHKEGKIHREDGPAIEWADGSTWWYKNDQLHREDGPAKEYSSGLKFWYLNGASYSLEEFEKKILEMNIKEFNYLNDIPSNFTGVCRILPTKENYHLKNGERHREDGPAVEADSGYKAWYLNNKRHRLDGPAVERPNGTKAWYIDGIGYFSEKDFNSKIFEMNIKEFDYNSIPKDFTGVCRVPNQSLLYYKDGLLHREDGPAIEFINGSKEWYKDGQLHREDGPAYEGANGDKTWYQHGKIHRKDGPAFESETTVAWYQNGQRHRLDGPAVDGDGVHDKQWWIDGKEYSEEDFYKNKAPTYCYIGDIPTGFTGIAKISSLKATHYFKNGKKHREGGPAVEYENGRKEWYKNGELHREDGPACEFPNGDKAWYQNGKRHREDGPAIEHANGNKYWHLNGQRHRTDGPAMESANGSKSWYINGLRHREDGPAVEYADGQKEWWIDDKEYSKEDFHKKIQINKIEEFEYENSIPEKFTGVCRILSADEINYYKDGNLHREDGPAIESADGYKAWYINGKRHRTDGPAIDAVDYKNWYVNDKLHREDGPASEEEDGTKKWYINGLLHRTDGPACEYEDGQKEWYLNGKRHREDGPAIEWANGNKYWHLNGQKHREDGPAVEYASGSKEWWLNGIAYTEEEFNKKIKIMNIKEFNLSSHVPKDFTGVCKVLSLGETRYYKDGKLHQEDGPAIEHADGDKYWYLNGKLHRTDGPAINVAAHKHWYIDGKRHRQDGPAIEDDNGDRLWYLDGQKHRLDGPAVECVDGHKEWWIEGTQYTEEEFSKQIKEFKNQTDIPQYFTGACKILSIKETHYYKDGKLHREDGPAVIDENGYEFWYLNDKRHREDGPAVEYSDNQKEWFTNGKRHRLDGPAIEDPNGKSWYQNGLLHRTNGPAIEYANGNKEWYLHNQLHREDGPAIEWADGEKEWWINGREFSKEEFDLLNENTNSIVNTKKIKFIFNEASHRIIAEQCTLTIKALLIKLISMNSNLKNAELIMNSAVGKALLQSALGIVIYKTQDNEFLSKIGYELLTSSIANFENNIISHAINYEVKNQIRIDDSISITPINLQENINEEYEDILIDCSDFEELCL